MKRRICIGVSTLGLPWKLVLDQIGVSYEEIDFKKSLFESYSCIFLTSPTRTNELALISEYTKAGGATVDILGSHYFKNDPTSFKYKKHLRDNSSIFFEQYLDIYDSVSLIQEEGFFENTIYIEELKKGFLCFLGLDVDSIFVDSKYERKQFYDHSHLFPNELVNKPSKGKIRRTLEDLLIHLHSLQSIPFLKKNNFPDNNSSIFLFRVDSDFSNQEAIESLYKIASNQNIAMTWFLHAEAHENWLHVFKEMNGQEIALHGYKHGTSVSYSKNKENIERCMSLLRKEDIPFSGYCAPYGIWNEGISKIMDDFSFKYSSEFSLNYDDLPFTPISNNKFNTHLQIPIHPICIGSFLRKKASSKQMIDYFEAYIENQIIRNEPIVLYHHPMQGRQEVLEHIFRLINELDIPSSTFSDYADFWKKRNSHNFEAFFENDVISLEMNSENISYQAFWKRRKTNLHNVDQCILDQIDWLPTSNHKKNLTPEMISKLTYKSMQLRKWSLLDWYRREKL